MAFVRKAGILLHGVALAAAGMLFLVNSAVAQRRPVPRAIPQAKPIASLAVASVAQQPQAKYKGIWEPISYPDDVHFFDVFFTTADEGWVAGGANETAGGIILHTTDAGDHWDVQYGDPQSSERAINELRFLDQTHGWAVQRTGSASRLLHTRDGKMWVIAGTIDENHSDYMFTSETTGVSLSKNVIKVTVDGGRTWKPVFPCAAKIQVNGLWQNVTCEWRRLQFLTPSIAYAVAKSYDARTQLFLARTTDGGATWSMATQELTDYPEDAFFVDANTGYVRVGAPDTGQLYKTVDGGNTWTGMATSPGKRIQFADPEVGWSVLYQKVSFTTDGGNRWNSREYPFPAAAWAFSLPRRDRGYVVGEHGMIYRYRMVPLDYAAKGMIPAPLLSGINSPLDAEVQQLTSQVNELAAKVGLPPASVTDSSGASGGTGTAGGSTNLAATSPAATAPGGSSAAGSTETGGAGASLAGGFTQDVNQAESTLNSVSSEVPQFVSKYKSLNLLLLGFQTASQLPAQVQGLKQSFQSLKGIKDPQAATAALQDMQTKVTGLVQMVRLAFQRSK